MIIAVDGPSGAGKSSVCREVAHRLHWSLLDTGAIYRCVALTAMEQGVDTDPEACGRIAAELDIRFVASPKGQKVFIGQRDVTREIRTFETTQCVNHVSPMPQVREKLPKYMFPSKYIRLDAMPHNANGKIDRKKLAEQTV